MNNFQKSTVKKYQDILTVKGYAENTIKTYSHYLNTFNDYFDCNLYQLSDKDIETFFIGYKFTSRSMQNPHNVPIWTVNSQ